MIIVGSIVAYLLIGYLFAVWVASYDDETEETPLGLLIACNLMWWFFGPIFILCLLADWYTKNNFDLKSKVGKMYRIKS